MSSISQRMKYEVAMNVSDKVLVDTSAWIEFFRGREPGKSLVGKLLDQERVCCAGIILAELMQGAKSDREINVLRGFLSVFDFLEETAKTWDAAGGFSFSMRKNGKSIPLSDCLIAVLAVENSVQVLTFDRHFDLLAAEKKVNLFSF